jgi:hypothetical protein
MSLYVDWFIGKSFDKKEKELVAEVTDRREQEEVKHVMLGIGYGTEKIRLFVDEAELLLPIAREIAKVCGMEVREK